MYTNIRYDESLILPNYLSKDSIVFLEKPQFMNQKYILLDNS